MRMPGLYGSIIVTYRCMAKCRMCEIWKYPTIAGEEIGINTIRKLPRMAFCNVTGGEPFIRDDLPEIIKVLKEKTRRIVISTNGYFTDKIINLFKEHPGIGVRVSIEGLSETNDAIRGIPGGFDSALATLDKLKKMGIKDIGFAITIQDSNCHDIVPLYKLARKLGYEFATAVVHNSHYFQKRDNKVHDKEKVSGELAELVSLLLRSKRPKDWFRAYFNRGIINYINGEKRFIPCGMGDNGFFLDPSGDVLPCNGMDEKQSMGNLTGRSWEEIWTSDRAKEVRRQVRVCPRDCWMIGSVAPAIRKYPIRPVFWVLKNKIKSLFEKA